MFLDWLRWLHYNYIYAPKRMKIVQRCRESRRLMKQQRRFENQIREVWRTNPKKKPISDKFLLDERARRMIDHTQKSAEEIWTRRKRSSDDVLKRALDRIRDEDIWDSRIIPDKPKPPPIPPKRRIYR